MIKTGVGIIIFNKEKILLGKRKDNSLWGFPGGKLEENESIFDCAAREILEETGIQVKNLEVINFTNSVEDPHYLTINLKAEFESGELRIMEPDKFYEWKWFLPIELPDNLFKYSKEAYSLYQDNKIFKEI